MVLMAFNLVDSPSLVTVNSEQWAQIRREASGIKKKGPFNEGKINKLERCHSLFWKQLKFAL